MYFLCNLTNKTQKDLVIDFTGLFVCVGEIIDKELKPQENVNLGLITIYKEV